MILLAPVLLALVAIVGCMTFDFVARRSLRRMALRNIARRPAEALLVVVGAALGTAIITSAFVVGDTFDASIRDFGRTDLGPVDETVDVRDVGQLDAIATNLQSNPPSGTDGTLAVVAIQAATRAGGHAEPLVHVAELDFDAGRAFGGAPAATGLADVGSTPHGDEVVVNQRLADDLRVAAGDTIELFAYGQERRLTVRTVAPQIGLAGYADMYVAPGMIAGLTGVAPGSAPGTASGAEPPFGQVLVSNHGGVFDGEAGTDRVTDQLEQRLGGRPGVEISTVKHDLLEDAHDSGAEIRSLFTVMGTFSALVGVLLLVNLFVMLAEERKAELGMLRAVGMKRNHLVRLFGLEGGIYSLIAAVVGAVAGIGVGKVLVLATESIIAEDDLTFRFAAKPSSLATGAVIGLAISLLTVWGTSTRIARLNVIRAIRDLPEPAVRKTSRLRLVLGALGMVGGGLLLQAGLSGDAAIPTLIGPAIALASAIPLFGRWLPRRPVIAAAGGLSVLWAVFAIPLVPAAFEDADIEMFVAQGIVLVGGAVALVSQADRAWAWLADRLADRGAIAGRLAVAYPLARRVRTGILLAMFSLVIFTMTFMSSISDANLAQAPTIAHDAAAGWDLWVDSSPTSPLGTADVAADRDVAGTSTLTRGFAQLALSKPGAAATSASAREAESWPVSGFGPDWLAPGTPELSERLDRYPDDRAAFAAVAADRHLAIAPESLLEGDGPPGPSELEVGDIVTATDVTTGEQQRYTIAGLLESDWNWNGLLLGRGAATALLGDGGVDNRMYVRVADGADAEAVADRLTAGWVDHGADASTFITAVEDEMQEMQGFLRLLQGYLGLGLLIGIAGLGVVMVRAVRERRRQIGMLRALGFSSQLVRRAFLAEAGFVALQGIVLGIGLGLVVSYQLLHSDVMGEPLPFSVPWLAVAVLLVVPGAAALAAAYVPAAQASRIAPAAALRIAE
ncbi:MAG TPA: FtsX-like permease family protein [Acidimicrobiales bacterium]|nr:FtsX-like permease family protein [Acidimicrobiales bacterium]